MTQTTPSKLPRHHLEALLQARNVSDLSAGQIVNLFRREPGIDAFLPDGYFVTDPRNGDRILFNAARAHRPHDNRPPDDESLPAESTCIICQGQTTGIIDAAQLSQGHTFINKNLFPVVFPLAREQLVGPGSYPGNSESDDSGVVRGVHFLQWTSSHHDKDWHNMPAADRLIVMERLAALEEKLIAESPQLLQIAGLETGERPATGWVLITKNFGRLVGGSLAHGHQQIALSSVMPKRFADNQRFERTRGETFSEYMLRENPSELMIKDYGPAILMVPYFMRRPYDMMLLLKQSSRRHLYQLDQSELQAVADGWQDAIRIMRSVMPAIGRETAFNILTNNGPGAGLYFDFRPYTQEFGGFEQLGLLICQANPEATARRIRQILMSV